MGRVVVKVLLLCFFGLIAVVFGIVVFDGFIKYCLQMALIPLLVVSGVLLITGYFD